MTRPILHATDFSPASGRAFTRAVALAKAARAPLLLLHVINPTAAVVTETKISPPTFDGYRRFVRKSATKRLAQLVRRAAAAGVRAMPLVVDGGEPREIAQVARARRASMIVVGTHGRTGLASFMLGSVAKRVIAAAPCPVLTVRGG